MSFPKASAVFAACVLLACASFCAADEKPGRQIWMEARRQLITEIGTGLFQHTTVECNSTLVGSVAGCYDQGIKAIGNDDYPLGSPEVAYPTDGKPWGIHLTGPYPDGVSYLVSWMSYGPTVGDASTFSEETPIKAMARLSTKSDHSKTGKKYKGTSLTYTRVYTTPTYTNYSYMSPMISHVVLRNLKPKTQYFYSVGDGHTMSAEMSFTTLPYMYSKEKYPLRVGLIADLGQTANSSTTRDHLKSNNPDVIILTADFTYADDYGAIDPNTPFSGSGTNQNRWDTFAQLWQPVFSTVPTCGCAGNHELETSAINAVVNYTTFNFSYPTNYPFQTYSARQPVPGTHKDFGNIDNNLYYSTIIGGSIHLITLNNYIPFQPGSPQHSWAMDAFAAVDRKATPWLFVQFHAPPYHTYYTHYKEQECFMSVYEDMFYQNGVDVVLNGHVHAYERTHPVYKYELDTCAPIYITIGDAGNIEGPYRNFVDDVNPSTNMTYCEMLTASGLTPNQVSQSGNTTWGPSYQRQAHAPNCTTTSWQPASGVAGGPVLVPLAGTENSSMPLGFCQSSQPVWSAHRDPSFGHAIMEVMNDREIQYTWYRNEDGLKTVADSVTLERLDGCPNRAPKPSGSRKML